jgi:hypothetical protein
MAGVGRKGLLAYHTAPSRERAACTYNNKPDNVQVNDQVIRRDGVAGRGTDSAAGAPCVGANGLYALRDRGF